MKLGVKRKVLQITALIVSNLGFFRILKTGLVCPFLYCHGCPFAVFGCPVGVLQRFIAEAHVPFFTIGSLGVYGLVFGRFFCGWACPFGALQDLLKALRGRKTLETRRVWYTKFIFLFIVLGLAWFFLDTIFCKFCPSGSLFATLPALVPLRFFNRGFSPSGIFLYIHVLTLVLTLISALFISHFWCRYLCPLGAVVGGFNRVSFLTIGSRSEKCHKCNVCLQVCEMGIKRLSEVGNSTDCTLCGRCVEACPEKALYFMIRK